MSETASSSVEKIVESLRTNREKKTVGYGDQYPRSEDDHLVVKMSNRACGVTHEIEASQLGYKYVRFGDGTHGVKAFISILEAVGLDPIEDYSRVYRDIGHAVDSEYPPRFLHCWANGDLLAATTNNAITGESHSERVVSSQGQTGFVGVEGKSEYVGQVERDIESKGRYEDKRPGQTF